MRKIKALSVKREYALQISDGTKSEEYRNWKTEYRGDLLICSSRHCYSDGVMRPGFAVCVVDLYDIERDSGGGYIWRLRNVRWVKPFEVKGKLRLFDVCEELVYMNDWPRAEISRVCDEFLQSQFSEEELLSEEEFQKLQDEEAPAQK